MGCEKMILTAKMQPFGFSKEDTEDIDKGYSSFYQFYKKNYLRYMPDDKQAHILVISCGPGYFVNLLVKKGYSNVLGIDSNHNKVKYAQQKNLNCISADAFSFLAENESQFELIFCEQEINHLTKEEILIFLKLCHNSLKEYGTLIFHSINGANPITATESLAQNFDHYNTFTEYSLEQILRYSNFDKIKIIPLKLYVFYSNPLNYILILLDSLYTLFFRFSFMLYGKSNRIFTKKIAGICRKKTTL